MDFLLKDLLPNITYKTSRSGGKGGQNVNKVSSKVELNFDFLNSNVFTEDQKDRLKLKFINKLTSKDLLQIISEEERSQYLNKERSVQKLIYILKSALYVQKARKATKPKKSSIEKRLQNKQQLAVKKLGRRNNNFVFLLRYFELKSIIY